MNQQFNMQLADAEIDGDDESDEAHLNLDQVDFSYN